MVRRPALRRPPVRTDGGVRDFASALGLVFAIEGLLMAAFTERMRQAMAAVAQEDPARLRAAGLGAAVVGVAIVWATRSLL